MAEKTVTFPLNMTDEFRPRAEGWLKAHLGRGSADYFVLRDRMRAMLVTMDEAAAEMFAVDLMLPYRLGNWVRLTISLVPGPGDWKYDVTMKGATRYGTFDLKEFSSDHLCRIVTRMVEGSPGVTLLNWPEEWPKP